MKLFQIVSILTMIVSFSFLASSAYAAIQFYDTVADLDSNGNANIILTITFQQPLDGFKFAIFGSINDFGATSNAGPVICDTATGAASIVDCKLNLTQDKRTLEIHFTTPDFVKLVGNKRLFLLDLSLSQDISTASATIKLPEGFALANTSQIPAVSPPANNIISDGRRIIVNWNFANISSDKPLKIQTLYEPLQSSFPLTLLSIGMGTLAVIGGGILFYYRRAKQPKEVILSVLDDFEKQVVEAITGEDGETTQRKVVQLTNLSKAKVSRVVKRLQERGLIEVIRLGRTNKLKLVKRKFEGN